VNALIRITTEVGFMLSAPTQELVVSAETKLSFNEANKALEEVGETIEYDE
jgi:hypothetical protein